MCDAVEYDNLCSECKAQVDKVKARHGMPIVSRYDSDTDIPAVLAVIEPNRLAHSTKRSTTSGKRNTATLNGHAEEQYQILNESSGYDFFTSTVFAPTHALNTREYQNEVYTATLDCEVNKLERQARLLRTFRKRYV